MSDSDDMRAEYDFSGGVRGKHIERMKSMRLRVVLEPDVARLFPTSEAVNQALRLQAKSRSTAGAAGAKVGRRPKNAG